MQYIKKRKILISAFLSFNMYTPCVFSYFCILFTFGSADSQITIKTVDVVTTYDSVYLKSSYVHILSATNNCLCTNAFKILWMLLN